MLRFVSSLLVLGYACAIANAQTPKAVPAGPKTLESGQLAQAPKIDGVFGEGEWAGASHGEGFVDKDTGTACDEKGEFWLAYDSKFVYFAARAYTDPGRIVDDEYRQNVSLSGNDAFMVGIDAQASGQDIDLFQVNPQGATSLRLSGGRAAKTEWLGEFDASGKVTQDGWQVEARIPWSLLTLPPAGKHDLVFDVLWYRSKTSNTYEWVLTKEDFRNFPRWTGVDVPAVAKERTLNLLPYFYAGLDEGSRHIANGGLDLKTELDSSMTLVGTVNPDFRNIENDILSLDHSYFERLANDARPFFQEGSRYRSFGFDQRIYASQRISDFDAGVNVYGKVGRNSQLGVLTTVDVGNQLTFAGSMGHRFDDSRTLDLAYVRNEQKGLRNDAVHLFFDQRIGDYDYFLTFQGTDDAVMKTGTRIDTGIFKMNGGTTVSLDFIQVTPDFFPRLGFSPEQDMRGVAANWGREIQPKGGNLQSYSYELKSDYFTHLDGSEYRGSVGTELEAHFRNDYALGLEATASRFEGSDDYLVSVGGSRPVSNPYRGLDAGFSFGRFGGIQYRSLNVNLRYRPVKRMQLAARTQWVDFGEFQKQIVLSANYDIGKYDAIGGRLVRKDNDWNWYLSYRVSGKRGNEFYVILGDPNATEFRKSLVIKAVIPVTIRM